MTSIRKIAESLPRGLVKSDFELLWIHYKDMQKGRVADNGKKKLKVKPKANPDSKWLSAPTRKGAIKAWENRSKDSSEWTALTALGCFHTCYYAWCKAYYVDDAPASTYHSLRRRIDKDGVSRTVEAIQALFNSRALAWVKQKSISFITDEDKWSRFTAPALVKSRPKGEQAEHTAEATEELVVRRIR